MNIIKVQNYFPAKNADYANNCLIELFPALSRDNIESILASDAQYLDEERFHSADLRLQYVRRLSKFFSPLPDQTDFAYNLWTTICDGYTRFNPAKRDTQKSFIQMCEDLQSNTFSNGREPNLFKSPNCIAVIGTPGTGKSEVGRRLLSTLSKDAVFHHTKGVNVFQKLYVWVEAPNAKHEKSLAWLVYEALYQAVLDTGVSYPKLKPGLSATVIGQEAAVLARKLNIGVVVVDEIQHCVHLTAGLDNHSMEFLTSFINRVNCPVLLIGTWKAAALLSSEFRLARRTTTPGSTLFHKLPPGKLWDAFTNELWNIQFTQTKTPWTPEIATELYFHSQGVQDIAVKLFSIAQMEAISSGTETVDVLSLRSTAEAHLHFIAPSIEVMRSGTNESDHSIWDAEPPDFQAYLLQLQAHCETRLNKSAKRTALSKASKAQKVQQLSDVLVGLGLASDSAADAIAQQAVERSPSKPASALAITEIQSITRAGPKPTRATKKMAQVDVMFAALPSDDIRRIVFQANRSSNDAHDALAEALHIVPLADLVET